MTPNLTAVLDRVAAAGPPPTAKQWNDTHPVGIQVWAYPDGRSRPALRVATRSAAWTPPGSVPVVSVIGHTGPVPLTDVDPVTIRRRHTDAAIRCMAEDIAAEVLHRAADGDALWQAFPEDRLDVSPGDVGALRTHLLRIAKDVNPRG